MNTHTIYARSRRKKESRQFSFLNSSFARRLRVEELEDRRLLAVFTVSNLNDGAVAAADDAPGTLRQAIFDANALGGSDTIEFAGGLSGTILLTEGEITISESVAIIGPGAAQLTIEAFDPTPEDVNGDGNRVFNIDDSTATVHDASISGLTITGGDVDSNGGGIRSTESLTIVRSHITGNSVWNDTGFLNAGGGVYVNYGDLSIEDSTISNNYLYHDQVAFGGGIISSNGNVTIRNTTVTGNTARTPLGVSGGTSYGGGLGLGAGTHLIAHSTFTDNRVSGMDGYGGGIYAYGNGHTTTLEHTIVANNTGEFGRDISSTSAVNARFSLVENISGWVLGTDVSNIFSMDPMLSEEAIDYGGPTPTHALFAGSPAIDAGNFFLVGDLPFDQRGAPFDRIADGDGVGLTVIDIGAYEVQTVAGLNLVVDTLVDEVDADFSAGDLSLREAIGLANGSVGPDTITFDAELSGQAIVLTKGDLRITDDLTIDGQINTGVVVIDAAGNDPTPQSNQGDGSRIFWIQVDDDDPDLIDVELIGLHLTGGDVTGNGGAVYSRETLQLTDMTIDGNFATRYGGGVDQGRFDATLTIDGSTISRNIATGGTGGIVPAGFSTRGGGGIRVSSSDTEITSSTISGNRTVGNDSLGGGIASFDNDITIRHSTITGNSTSGADAFGGNVAFRYGDNFILDHTIVANGSAQSDNDIHSPNDSIMADDSLIEDVIGLTLIGSNNTTGSDPLLGPLVENGGPTRTHALLVGSPAIDGGDFTFSAPPNVDQRGTPFTRIFNGDGDAFTLIDIGAYELQTVVGLNLVVDTTADENDGDYSAGDLSLREAIGLANGSIGSDTITFASDLIGKTINLVLGELQIVDDLIIDATSLAGKITIDASGNDPTPLFFPAGDGSRVINIDDGNASSFIDVELIGLTLTGGDLLDLDGGGAILSSENLTVVRSTISGNGVKGILFGGGGSYTTIGGRGGGIHVQSGGTLDLVDSTVHSNIAAYGGGLSIDEGQITITSSTISSNSASEDGGGLWATGTATSITANHSTIARNHADEVGGGVLADNTGSITLNHTIVADNDAGIFAAGPSDVVSVDSVTFDHGWVETASGFTPTGGVQFIGVDPQLAPLADNGGPTRTHALLAGSPAIEVGNLFFTPPPATDQRGAPFVRVFDANADTTPRIDIGAYEWQTVAGLNLVVDVATDETNGNYNPGDLSLREAVSLANGSVGTDTITFASGLSGATITLVQGEVMILEDVTIDAMPLAQNVIVDASGNDPTPAIDNSDGSRLFLISDNNNANVIDVTLGGLELTGGDAAGNGGAILSFENLMIEESTIRDNVAATGFSAGGGGIFAGNENLVIVDSTISGNRTRGVGRGGGIYLYFSDFTLTNSTVSGNVAGSDGGGIHARGASNTVDIAHSTISDNTASQSESGGGIQSGTSVSLTVNHTIVANNQAGTGADISAVETISLTYSLVEEASGFTSNGSPNITGQDPLLGPLADNGGPTQTHALLEGSPAIDMGEFGISGEPTFDQRGAPFDRIVATLGAFEVIDIGAVEAQSAESADFDDDGDVDGSDFLTWQRGVGTAPAAKTDGDADNDADVDGDDLDIWQNQFGQPAPLVAAASTASSESPALMVQPDETTLAANLIDTAIALDGFQSRADDGPQVVEEALLLPVITERVAIASFTTASSNDDTTERPRVSNLEEEASQPAWLSDELLESIFG